MLSRTLGKLREEEYNKEQQEFARQFPGVTPVKFRLNGTPINT